MKTTIEIPDALFKRAKAKARSQGVPLEVFLQNSLVSEIDAHESTEPVPPWLGIFDGLKRDAAFHAEVRRINKVLEEEFEKVEPEEAP